MPLCTKVSCNRSSIAENKSPVASTLLWYAIICSDENEDKSLSLPATDLQWSFKLLEFL